MAEGKECLSTPTVGARGKRDLYRGDPPEVVIPDPSLTIFSKSFLSAAFDEIHVLRNQGTAYQAVLRLSENSLTRMGCTATPVFTGTKVSVPPTTRCIVSQYPSLFVVGATRILSLKDRRSDIRQ